MTKRWWDDYTRPELAAGPESTYRVEAAPMLQAHATPGTRAEALEFTRQHALGHVWKLDSYSSASYPSRAVEGVNQHVLDELHRIHASRPAS